MVLYNTMNLDNLKELGLSRGQIQVYAAVLDLGISTLNKIQEKTGIERRNIYDILNKLIEAGLISYTVEKGKRTYQCTHPNKLLQEIKERERKLKDLEEQIPSIKNLFELSKPDIKAEVFRGNEAIKSLFEEILDYKESFWLGGNSFEGYQAVPQNLQIWFEHWMTRRIENKQAYYKYCTLPKDMYVPMVIIIFGNKVAQVLWSQQSFAFILESDKIKQSFMKYFNYFWKNPY